MHVAYSFVSVVLMDNPAHPVCIPCLLLLFPRLQLLLIIFQLLFCCLGNLMYLCSCLFHILVCVVCINISMSLRARAFPLHPHFNLSCICDRPYTCVNKSWSSFITSGQPKHAQICHYCSNSMAMIFATHLILEFTSDVSSCTKQRPHAACASFSSHWNSMWSLSFFLHPLF